ncbi:Ig-like domain-containing protein [uncultured Methanobrevibacter sp.]|uniref:Ig-like domain-containing protein n=1 Tax=uncultured Methanobrevibacter sp. TaxID=253161 RepID=UPI0025D3074C|nr:Ig-like domain-containing protein [uncultured Methanobrevibacter sp.]
MKFKREIIAIMLIICMLFTISAISAADSDDVTIGVANETVEATSQDYSLESNDDVEILKADNENALSDLQQTINSATDGSTIVLDRDYEYDMGSDYETRYDGVTIDKNLTIDGQNHKIDGKGESAIFLVNPGLHVTFKNIVFMNGKAYYGGAAIYSSKQVVGNVINCTFIKNTNLGTNYAGGAINIRSNNWNIINSTFINNTDSSNYGGGAIYAVSGDFIIRNSEFINSSGKYGGAIFLYSATTQIINSTFEKNTGSSGGVIYAWSAEIQIYSSTFEKNTGSSGGVVYLYNSNNNYIDNSTFENNEATYGGVVYLYNSNNNYIDNSTFENNKGIYHGGVIYGTSGSIIKSTNSKFINNSADYYGGAIYASKSNITSINSQFINTSSNYYWGGVIYASESDITSIDSQFINSFASNYGGVIYASESNITSIDSKFINNSDSSGGGAIYASKGNIKINNSTFVNNTDSSSNSGGAVIYSNSVTLDIINSKFINNSANYYGGAIYAYESNITSADSMFINNSAKLGGAIASHSGRIQINNSTFKNNNASNNGGAIWGTYSINNDLGSIANSTFINNFALNDGGAIYNYDGNGGIVDRCIFINNTVSDVSKSTSAIYYMAQITNSIFLNHEGRYIFSNNPIISNNWFGNDADNFDECPLIVNERPFVDNWYYFDVTSKGNHLIWSLKLYNRSTGESSVVENYNLPDITFSLTPQNLTIDNRKMKMNKTGQYDLEYALTSETGLLSVQYETFKYDLEIKEAEFDALQELINSANAYEEIKLTRNYTYTPHIDSIVNGIVIDKPGLTIDGNGFTIDARGQSRIFNVTENAQGVTIKNLILTNGSASEGSVIYSEGNNLKVYDSILLNNGENQISVTDSATIEKCWFGHTRENYTFGEYVAPSSALKSWYYLDIDDETANHAIVTLKLYDATTKQSSIDDDYNLPDITFKLSKENLNFDETEIKLNKSGQYDVEYTSVSAKGSITAEYETSKFRRVIGETDFERLQRYINEANAGDVINLYGDFIYQTGDTQIEITKKLTIDGHGFTIDAKNQCNIFNIHDAEYPGVDLKNIKFTNTKTSNWGSAIFSYSNMHIINCTFVNGTAYGGGFVYLLYTSYVTNCTFINGTASSPGGAIYLHEYAGRTQISGCTFINGTSVDGCAIYMDGENSIISNCTFINGTSGWGGGAIRATKAFSLINSKLINNTAKEQGGAIQSYAQDVYIYNTTFINNTSPQGGAIRNDKPNLTVINSTFIHNTVTGEGGAIANYGNNLTIVNSTFNNNSAGFDQKGGAICTAWSDGSNIINSTFFNNSGDCGAAVYIGASNSLIFNSTFIKNRETGTRSIVHNDKDNLKIDKCLFIENMGEDYSAAMVYGQSDTVVSNSIFLNNHARRVFSNGPFTIDNNWYGSTIDNYDQVPINEYGDVVPDNWLFVNATFDREMNITDIYLGKFVFQSYNNGEVSNYDASKLHDVNLTLSAENGEIDKRSAEMGDEITYTPTQLGTGNITANFFKNLGVSDKYVNITFEISKTPTQISLDDTSISVLAHHNILDEISPVVTPSGVEGTFSYTTDNSTIIDVTNSQSISGLKAGTAQLTITFNPTKDDSYVSSSITLDITVNKDTSGITAEPISFDYDGEPKDINVNLTPEYLNNLYKLKSVGLTFISTNTSVFTVDTNGKITPKSAGKANLTIRYEESDDYLASEKNITVTVNKVDSELILGNDYIVFNYLSSNTTTFTVTGGTVEKANIKVIDHDEAVIDLTGNVITVSNLTVGKYTLNVTTTPDGNHNAVSKTVGITVNRIAPTITIKNGETDSVNVKSSININANVDSGADLTYTPNETGIVSLEGNVATGLKAGKVNITVSVPETDNYLAGSKNITITVNRIDAVIDASDFNVDVNADKEISVNKPTDYNGEITYESKTPAVASVDNDGKVTGITGGDAIITIKWTQTDLYKKGSYNVTVTVKKITADISAVPLTVNVSETKGLTVNKPGDFDGTIVYTPQNPDNVTVDTNGDVTGLRGGDVVITLSWAESPKYLEGSETVTVTVNKIKPTITIEKGETASVDAGSTLDIGATGSGTLTFESNNTAVATVDANGVVTGVISGVVNITVYSAENDQYLPGSKNITVTVNKIEAKINASEIVVNVKDTNSLVVQRPDDYPSAEITFESQNNNIAYVGQDGVVSGKIGGDVVITISWEETEKYLSGSYDVNVHVEKLPANLHAQNLEVEYNHTKQISVTHDSNGVLSFKIADNNIATVENRNVKGLKIGETTLTISISGTGEYHSDSIEVPVKVVKTSPNLQAEAVLLHVGNTEPVVATHLGNGALSYEITDTNIATVDTKGNVTGVSDGPTTLKISIGESENYTSQDIEVNVVVTNKQIGNIIISDSQAYSVDVDGTILINATTNSDGTLTYSINDTSVASLSGNELTGIKGGEVKVTITLPETLEYSGLTVSKIIKVNKLTPEITIYNGESDVVDVDGNLIIRANTTSDGDITYASNAPNVATVDAIGKVTGIIGGKVNITVKSVENDKFKESTKNIIVTVNKLTPTITINNGNPVSVDVKSTVNINATKGDSDGILKYASGNESRAVIDTRGNIRGVTGYPVVITVSVTGTERYNAGSVDVPVQVNKINPIITINNKEPVSIYADEYFVIDASANGAVLTYGSCNSSIAAVGADGKVTGIIGGVVNITVYAAETDEYLPGSKNLTVTVNKLTPQITIYNGESDVVDVDGNLIIRANTTSKGDITYASNATNVATVDAEGNVTGVTGGLVNITVKSVETPKYNELTKNIIVTVNKLTPVITVNNGNPVSVDVKSTVNINVTTDSDGILKYASGNESRAVIDTRGNIRGVTGYPVVITVSVTGTERYNAGSVDVPVQVNKIDPVITINNAVPVSVDADDSFVIDASANGAVLSYGSCNSSIAAVGDDGNVTGIIGGVVNITVYAAETDEYLPGSKNLTVTVNKIDAVITPEALVLDVFETKHLTVSIPDDFKGTIVYASQNPENVTVDTNGDVTGLKGGDAVILLSWNETDKYREGSTTATVTVNKINPIITINNGESASVGVDKILSIDASANGAVLSYESNDTGVAVVDINTGKVTGKKAGTANITVYAAETDEYLPGSKNITVTVNKNPSTIIVYGATSIDVFGTMILEVITESTGRKLVFESSNGEIADVSQSGVVYGLMSGKVTITVTALENEKYLEKSATITITVNKIEPQLGLDVANITVGEAENAYITVPDPGKVYVKLLKDSQVLYSAIETLNYNYYKYTNADLGVGNYTIIAKYYGSSRYTENTISKEFIVRPIYKYEFDVEAEDTVIGDEVNVTVTLPDDAEGIIKINDNEYEITGKKTVIALPAQTKSGKNNITVKYIANEGSKYDSSQITIGYNVAKKDAVIKIDPINDVKVGDNVSIKVVNETDGALTIKVNGKEVSEDYEVTKAGTYIVTVESPETDVYTAGFDTYAFAVDKLASDINLTVVPGKSGEKSVIEFNVTDGASGSVVIDVNGTRYAVDVADGGLEVVLGAGSYPVVATYSGDDKYNAAESGVQTIDVGDKLPDNITIIIDDVEYNITPVNGTTVNTDLPEELEKAKQNITNLTEQLEDAKAKVDNLTGELADAKANATKLAEDLADAQAKVDNLTGELADAKVKVDNLTGELADAKANATKLADDLADAKVKVDNLTGELADAKANATKLADDLADANAKIDDLTRQLEEALANKTKTVIVDGVEYPIEYVNGTAVVNTNQTEPVKEVSNATITTPGDVKAGESANVTVSVPGATGNVSVIIDGVETVVPLDENGNAVIPIENLTAGEHSVVVVYDGDDTYAGFHKAATFAASVISSDFVNVTVDGSGYIDAVLVDSMGNPIANATVVYKINGAEANITTDENGWFLLKNTNNAIVEFSYAGSDFKIKPSTSVTTV